MEKIEIEKIIQHEDPDQDENFKSSKKSSNIIAAIFKIVGMDINKIEQYKIIGRSHLVNSKEFKKLMLDIPWVTYRSNFKSIDGYTSDSGWGCMIRVAQMMLANTLINTNRYKFRVHNDSDEDISLDISTEEHMKVILPLFLDNYEGADGPFSIRNLVRIGQEITGKSTGEWYGAHSISQVIREANDIYNKMYSKRFKIITFNDGIVYREDLLKTFESNSSRDNFYSILTIIPSRIGLNKVDPIYYPQIKGFLDDKLSVGILGGKSYSAMYYIGYK